MVCYDRVCYQVRFFFVHMLFVLSTHAMADDFWTRYQEAFWAPGLPVGVLKALVKHDESVDDFSKISICDCAEHEKGRCGWEFADVPHRDVLNDYTIATPSGEYYYDKAYQYVVGENLSSNGVLVIVCVHGTGSGPDSFGLNAFKPTTQAIYSLARVLSYFHNCAVRIVTYKWSGTLSYASRMAAAEYLLSEIVLLYKRGLLVGRVVMPVWVIGHSHGCSVLNQVLSDLCDYPSIVPKVGVYLASPVPSKEDFLGWRMRESLNVDYLFHFFSWCDMIQLLGSFQASRIWGREIPCLPTQKSRVYNIHVQLSDAPLYHRDMKSPVLQNILGLVYSVLSQYQSCYNLDATLLLDEPLIESDRAFFVLPKIEKRETAQLICKENHDGSGMSVTMKIMQEETASLEPPVPNEEQQGVLSSMVQASTNLASSVVDFSRRALTSSPTLLKGLWR